MARDGTLDINLPIAGYHGLFQLCDHFEAPTVAKGILKSLLQMLRQREYPPDLDAWEVFKIAANQDDPVLAKEAVQHFVNSGHKHRAMSYDNPAHFIFAEIPRKYAQALYESGFQVTTGHSRYKHTTKQYEGALIWTPNDMKANGDSFGLSQ